MNPLGDQEHIRAMNALVLRQSRMISQLTKAVAELNERVRAIETMRNIPEPGSGALAPRDGTSLPDSKDGDS